MSILGAKCYRAKRSFDITHDSHNFDLTPRYSGVVHSHSIVVGSVKDRFFPNSSLAFRYKQKNEPTLRILVAIKIIRYKFDSLQGWNATKISKIGRDISDGDARRILVKSSVTNSK